MARQKKDVPEEEPKSRKGFAPAANREAKENQMISLAMKLAEERLKSGKATSQEIIHFLKLGTDKERIEKEILEKQKSLLDAKTESLKSAKRNEEMYQKAIEAMKIYQGDIKEDEYD